MRGARLPVLSGAFGLAATVTLLLGLDAAAEMPADVRRVSVLIGSALGAVALSTVSAALVALHGRRVAAARRHEGRRALHAAIDALAESLADRGHEAAPPAVRRRRA